MLRLVRTEIPVFPWPVGASPKWTATKATANRPMQVLKYLPKKLVQQLRQARQTESGAFEKSEQLEI